MISRPGKDSFCSNLLPKRPIVEYVWLAFFVLVWSLHSVVVKMSSKGTKYDYNPAILVGMCDCTKMVVSVFLMLFESECRNIEIKDITMSFQNRDYKLLVPALGYSLCNNLHFVNLLSLNPHTFTVLSNIRILTTALLSWVFLGRNFTSAQLLSLLLLAAGCAVAGVGENTDLQIQALVFVTVTIQASLASISGVYNEKMLKHNPPGLIGSLNWSNGVLYSMSSVLDVIFMILRNDRPISSFEDVFFGIGYREIWIVALLSAGGLAASRLLKFFSAVTKAYATASEMLFTGLLTRALLGTTLEPSFFLSFGLVSIALVLYNTQGGKNQKPGDGPVQPHELVSVAVQKT